MDGRLMADPRTFIRAAQYVRMSTERQDYSITHQKATIATYALERGYRIVQTYEDAGISGVTIEKRAGLRQLIEDVITGSAQFDTVLVYDVSRWGRFQNPDQSAHYEFICSEAGVRVEYCAEPFENDGSPASSLIKQLKRTMAAEYSRELSEKISLVKRGLSREGYWQGGAPGFGLRRQSVARDGRPVAVQEYGEWSARGGGRTRLVPGPIAEIETVRRMYRLFLRHDGTYSAIARRLNEEGILGENGAVWSLPRVRQVLTNEKYVGCLVTGRSHDYLGRRIHKVPRREWIRVEGALEPIVSKQLFGLVRRKVEARRLRVTDAEALADLRRIFDLKGKLSEYIIASRGKWSMLTYVRRLGGLPEMYRLLGHVMPPIDRTHNANMERCRLTRGNPFHLYRDEDLLDGVRRLWAEKGYLSEILINGAPDTACCSTLHRRFGSLSKVYELIGYSPTPRQLCGARAKQYLYGKRAG